MYYIMLDAIAIPIGSSFREIFGRAEALHFGQVPSEGVQ